MIWPIWWYRAVLEKFFQNYKNSGEIGGDAKMDIQIGNIVKMKKAHPCGSTEWEVLRIGADFRLKCCGCGHQIMISRGQAEKNIREKL